MGLAEVWRKGVNMVRLGNWGICSLSSIVFYARRGSERGVQSNIKLGKGLVYKFQQSNVGWLECGVEVRGWLEKWQRCGMKTWKQEGCLIKTRQGDVVLGTRDRQSDLNSEVRWFGWILAFSSTVLVVTHPNILINYEHITNDTIFTHIFKR